MPIHSVSSYPVWSVSDRSASALRIRVVLKGYLVRKDTKRIMSIEERGSTHNSNQDSQRGGCSSSCDIEAWE
ncbi:hypothetical protein P3S67_021572 [Capsicum chacoense]